MQLRFSLIGRIGHSRRWRRLSGPGLGVWYASASPQVAIFRYRKEIVGLTAPGAYRAFVHFRWLDAHGRVLRYARRSTAICRQPDQRPDLVPTGVTAMPADGAGRARYLVDLRNAGLTDAGPFHVRLVVAGQPQPEQTVEALGTHAETTIGFEGPRCPAGARVRVVVDAEREVAEAREANNVLTSRCLPPTTRQS